MSRLSDLLPGAIGRRDVLRVARANKILNNWHEVVGEFLAARSWPDRYDHGIIYVAVEGSAWAQELRMMKERILLKLADLTEEEGLFLDLRFGVRVVPKKEVAALKVDAKKHRESLAGLSIREIVERRLGIWQDEG